MGMMQPLKWELKQKPGISPPRGGFKPDDPNQQIVAEEEDIFDEYGGMLSALIFKVILYALMMPQMFFQPIQPQLLPILQVFSIWAISLIY